LENVFQFIFHDTTKHRKIIYFLGIYFSRKLFSKKKLFFSKQKEPKTLILNKKLKYF